MKFEQQLKGTQVCETDHLRTADVEMGQIMSSIYGLAAGKPRPIETQPVDVRETSMFGDGFKFADAPDIYCGEQTGSLGGRIGQDILTQAIEPPKQPEKSHQLRDAPARSETLVGLPEWMRSDGNSLAKTVAKMTVYGGLMVLGPTDYMRAEAERFNAPKGFFPVFTHASAKDFHMYYGLHVGRKEYSVEVLAELIKEHAKKGQAVLLMGCESGVDDGIARELADLLHDNPVYAPNGFGYLKDGKAYVLKKRPSEVHSDWLPAGQFVLVKPMSHAH
jgi:hypothetical protein